MTGVETSAPDELRAQLLRSRLAGGAGARSGASSRIAPTDRSRPLPLSFGQQRLWLIDRIDPGSTEYVVPLALRLRGSLDTPAWSQAWQDVVARHEVLRTRYVERGGEPQQLIDPPVTAAELEVVDVASAPDPQALAHELATELSSRPFDLAADWPVRALLIRLGEQDHVLALSCHHIALDGWSIDILVRELRALYQARVEGRPSPLPELPIQYADYAVWERETLARRASFTSAQRYWREQLADIEPLELPTDRPRPARRDWTGRMVPFDIPAELADRLRAIGRDQDTTLYAVLLASFNVLLHRYTGSRDISVGSPVAGRGRPEASNLIGFFINTLVLRNRWEGDPAFAQLLRDTGRTVQQALISQEVPFEHLVRELAPDRDPARSPLFQVMLGLRTTGAYEANLAGLTVSEFPIAAKSSRFDLTVLASEHPDGSLNGEILFPTALFDDATVERIGRHYLALLRSVAEAPQLPLSRLSFLDQPEIDLLTEAGSRPRADTFDHDVRATVHELFEAQALRTPDATALVVDSGDGAPAAELSYAQLNQRANRIAHRLRQLGAGPEQMIGICLERGEHLVPALLGILKSGAGYLPLDPAAPADRLAYVIGDAHAPIVLTQSEHAEKIAAVHTGAVLDLDSEDLAGLPTADPKPWSGPDNLIYTIYTSGSTGRPKGVVLTHAHVARLLTSAERHYGFSPKDVWPLFHSYAFDVSVWELWGSLLYGGKLVVVPASVTRSPSDFLDVLVRHEVTFLNQTPSAFRALVAAAADDDPRIGHLALRAVVFAGEKLEPAELRPWTDRLGLDAPCLYNMYGITETTVHSTFYRITEQDLAPSAPNAIGRPLDDLRIYLLDGDGGLAPVGVPGEIYVGGAGVARGYAGRPDLTAARFVPDPFGRPGARLYRSGDLARRRADGSLEFLGRADHQVKIRGYRVELGEIEATVASAPTVRDAVVIVREDTPGDKRLVAYVVPEEGVATEQRTWAAQLRSVAEAALPAYMVPSAFVTLAALPLTVNGKLDRRALPAPDGAALAVTARYVAPRTHEEQRAAEIWREVLGIDRVGVEDGFFELGGDSLLAVALTGTMRAAGFDVAVKDVFEQRTVAQLCAHLAGRDPLVEQRPPVEPFALLAEQDRERLPAGVVDAYPISGVQLGMVVEMLADSGERNYHNVTSMKIDDDAAFDADAFDRAAQAVVARHENLRTSFDLDGYSRPLQLVHESAGISVDVQDLRELGEQEQLGAMRAWMARERDQPFDLSRPSLIRLAAHLTGENTWWLTITECHAVLEGWSYHQMLMEIIDLFGLFRSGRQPEPEPAAAVRYADFIAAELESLADGEDAAYWAGIVAGRPAFRLPQGWGADPATPRETYRTGVSYLDLLPQIKGFAARAGVSVKAVLHAVHLKVMSMITAEERFFSGLVCDARPEAVGADRVYGMYLNTVPFPFEGTDGTWTELVRRVFATEIDLWPHRRHPIPAIQRAAGGERMIDAYFNFIDFHVVDGERVDYLKTMDISPNEFSLRVTTQAKHFSVTVNTHVVSRANADRLAAMYRAVLEAMLTDPDGEASRVPLADDDLRVLDGLVGAPLPAERRPAAPSAFRTRAGKRPDDIAVVCDGEQVAYGELDRRSDLVAELLRRRGVSRGDVVAVSMRRTPAMIAALLGVWKAGAAYLPLDVGLPAERVRHMLADSGARIVLDDALSDLAQDSTAPAPTPPTTVWADDDLAYVIYTSGSTGKPKGVEIGHGALANLLASMRDLAGDGCWLASTALSFDICGLELFGPLTAGGRIVLAADSQLRDGAELVRLVEEHGVDHVQATPSGWKMLLAAGFDRPEVTALCGGEALPLDLARHLRGRVGRLLNVYGPTETTIWSTAWEVPVQPDRVVVGAPLADTRLRVLDARGARVPVGVVGELVIGGAGVARGYHAQPQLTAARFTPARTGGREYRTGDLVRVGEDGEIEFLGRADDQVKVRGHRIELGEIETVLRTAPGVRDVVVTARGAQDKTLVAYVIGALDGLAAFAAEALPSYMVPSVYTALDAFPLNPAGKVDRLALPEPAYTAAETFTAPSGVDEERIALIWRQALDVPRVGALDGFFELGGDSIKAVGLVGALRAAGYDASARDVFEHSTVRTLAAHLSGRPAPRQSAAPVEPFALAPRDVVLPDDVVDAYPLSMVQLGMVAQMLSGTGSTRYHTVTAFPVNDGVPFDEQALRRATAVVVERHEILRTSIELTEYGTPLQSVHAQAELPLAVRDLRGYGTHEASEAMQGFAAVERSTPMTLTDAPLMRLTASVVDDGTWWLSIAYCHAILEGFSLHALTSELLRAYATLRDGGEPEPWQAPAVRFADYIAAELASLDSEEDRAYWASVVAGRRSAVLPAGWHDPDLPRSDYRRRIPFHDLRPGLNALAVRSRTSLKSVLHAAHLKVMSSLLGDEPFFDGLVCDGRPESIGADRVYGMYLNSVPFAFDGVAAGSTWVDLVRTVFAREVELWPHRRHPLPEIARSSGDGQLLSVLFNYLDFSAFSSDLVDAGEAIGEGATEFDLAVTTGGGHVTLATHTGVLSLRNADRIGQMYRAVLEAMAADPDGDACVAHLPDGERERATSARGPVLDRGPGVLETIELQARATPDADAVIHGDERISFAELDARASALAVRLREHGVAAESTVGVLLGRTAELLVAFLGVWKAGGAYVPIDPTLPQERVDHMLGDSRSCAVITLDRHRHLLGGFDGPVIDVAGVEPGTPIESGRDLDPDSLAYVIYTSGSTGRPKGVQNTHRGVATYLHWSVEQYAGAPGGAPLLSSPSFDMVVTILYAPLMTGNPVTIFDEETPIEDLGLLLLESGPFSFVKVAPTLLDLLSGQLGPRQAAEIAAVAVAGGEVFDTGLARRWARLARGARDGRTVRIVNEYGPTEITVGNSAHVADGTEGGDQLPIGLPIPNTSMYVLDRHREPVPVGVVGEIHVGGDGLARGYGQLPDRTAAAFVPNPYGPPGSRLYRTGDRGRMRSDGEFEFVERVDDQVKVHGYRIELGEVEAALSGCAGVRRAVVTVRGGDGARELVGYASPERGAVLSAAGLRAELAARLPGYMVPSFIVPVASIPVTANGKVDRAALPEPTSVEREQGSDASPMTAQQEAVAAVWREVLGVEHLAVDDAFFDVGGDSIKAVSLVGALRASGYDVSVRDVFEQRTVAGLAEALASRETIAAPAAPGVARFALAPEGSVFPDDVVDAYPISQVQLGMLTEMLAADPEHDRPYHTVTAFPISGGRPFSERALRDAAAIVLQRHEVLRTSFDLTGHPVPLQLVHGQVAVPVTVQDLRGRPATEREASIRAAVERETRALFDVEQAPLMRIGAYLVADDTWWLCLTHCHAVLEGWSHHSLLAELIGAYTRLRDGVALEPHRPQAVRYADFIAAENEAVQAGDDVEFWRRRVADVAKFTLPQQWAVPSGRPKRFQVRVPFADLATGLRSAVYASRTSMKAVLHAAHLKVMSMLTHESRFHTGLVVDARPEASGAERVYGMYLNSVPFVFERTAATWSELARQVYDQETELWPHRRLPLPALQRAVKDSDLIDVLFNYLDFHEFEAEYEAIAPDAQAAVIGAGSNDSPFSVTTGGGFITIATDTRVLSQEHAGRIAQLYRAVLVAIATDPDGDATATFLPDGESDRQLRAWNSNEKPRPQESVLATIERRASSDPDACAVVAGEQRLTFAELDARASALAARLRAAGVGAETTVGVLLDRGPELIVAFLAVWKAHGAYVPLDPDLPADRIGYMLADSGARVVLTVSEDRFAAILHGYDGTVVTDFSAGGTPPERTADPDPQSLAYVIYTSGSTGRPKGVQISHAGLANYLWWAVEGYGAHGKGGAPLFSSIAFDMVVPNIYAPLMAGEPVTLLPPRFELDDLGQLLARGGPYSFIKLTPGHLDLLTHQLGTEQAATLAGMLAVGADSFPARIAERWFELVGVGPGPRMLNEYGPTEISVANSVHHLDGPVEGEVVSIGLPVPNTTMYVLDGRMRPLPVGSVGEIYIGGAGLARGYANLPARTAAAFVPDPFGEAGSRLYRTGDLARIRPDGNGEFLGRADHQIKLRGYRIEPDEVQQVLATHPAVKDVVVIVREETLVAYHVPASESAATPEELAAHCAKKLPPYMVPAAFVALGGLPLNANGKLDRGALPAPGASGPSAVPLVPPRTPTERALAALWSVALGVDEVGVEHDFFALGGHSLLMLRIVAQARKQGMALSVRDLVRERTVARLAAHVDSQATARSAALVWLAETGPRRTLFVPHTEGGSAHWFVPLADRLDGVRPVAAFEVVEPGSVRQMAARYLPELLAAQPEGPHTLLGWSSGATIAWEMSRLLVERGHGAPELILVDPLADLEPTASAPRHAGEILTELLDARGLDDAVREQAVSDLLAKIGITGGAGALDDVAGHVESWRTLTRACIDYRYEDTVSPVRLIVTDACAEGTHSVSRGHSYRSYLSRWVQLSGAGLRVDRLPGSHEAPFAKPGTSLLAALVNEVMTD
ncbi:amino acid adenylation domain-containing protein [Streptomyces sp. NBC_00485]|uniref:non-ribosomal peptide synthetase n=1 Tax=Streptomyces sp. NBC_00485 TaxID=2975758 RepID=UPI002E19FD58|nr:non-ribosomal peptide synthetase [Streptomyces sp. NBC_00485]